MMDNKPVFDGDQFGCVALIILIPLCYFLIKLWLGLFSQF